MARSSLLVIVVVGVVGGWLGTRFATGPAVLVGLLAGVGGALVLAAVERAKLRQLSRQVNAWMGKVDIEPLTIPGGHEVQELASALNALGAAYGRRGRRVAQADLRLRDVIEALPDPALLFGDDLSLVAANTEATELFNIASGPTTATQALGSAALVELVRTTVVQPQLHRLEAKLGDRIIDAATTPLADKVLLLARDRTQEAQIETLRRDFVANASHELKSPVTGIQSLADALDIVLDKDTQKAHSLVGRIRGEADRLAALVSDLLSLRRVDERINGEALEVLDIDELVASTVDEHRATAQDRQVDLTFRPGSAGASFVRVVPEDLRLVVANLVDNAVKYNRPGGQVRLTTHHVGSNIVIEVKDTGIGIPGKDLGRIFERFQRVDEGRSRAAGGTGLGLSIVRHAVERNGGHVSVTSLLGSGTTFQVTLPAIATETPF